MNVWEIILSKECVGNAFIIGVRRSVKKTIKIHELFISDLNILYKRFFNL